MCRNVVPKGKNQVCIIIIIQTMLFILFREVQMTLQL